MKNIARKLSALLLVFVVSAAALCPAFAASASLPSLPSGQCVVDDANVLSSSTVQTITDLNAQLESSCSGAQIGVLTVDYTGSCTTEEYALQAANAWGIGSSTGNNGVLILLVMETQQYADGDYYIATGDGFRNTTLESQASALAQTMEDDFVRQETALSHILCAESQKMKVAMGLDGLDLCKLLEVNDSATNMVHAVANLELVLKDKLEFISNNLYYPPSGSGCSADQ